jgi:putative two-component system response regulator
MDREPEQKDTDEVKEVEELDPQPLPDALSRMLLQSGEYAQWASTYLQRSLPSLFLDGSLRIIAANDRFCKLFDCGSPPPGQYFTQFYAPSFDETASAELFRAIRSPTDGYSWHGKVEKPGSDQLLNVLKIWILPLRGESSGAAAEATPAKAEQAGQPPQPGNGGPPAAYSAVCMDMTVEYRQLLSNTFASLLEAARLKDNDTGNHIERVNFYARVLAEALAGAQVFPEVDPQFVNNIGLVSALHDVGKIGTPDDILNKAARLEAWEWEVMKQHTTNGAYILSTYPLPMAREIALRHHERWDGTGYPHGLSEELTPLSARIVAVADVYDALRMRRAYKEPLSHPETIEKIVAERGTHFDPRVTDRFISVAERFEEIFKELADPQ